MKVTLGMRYMENFRISLPPPIHSEGNANIIYLCYGQGLNASPTLLAECKVMAGRKRIWNGFKDNELKWKVKFKM